jgi:hypothetical protein
MTFSQWLFSTYPNPKVDGAWGIWHILTMILCAAFIVASTILLKNKSERLKHTVLLSLAIVIVVLGVMRRINGFIMADELTLNRVLRILLPRPGCAISCWLVSIALIVKKKFFYNFASTVGILCATIFFAYPSAGFTNELLLFENLYSIVTHAFFLVIAVCFITYGFTDFKYGSIYKEGFCFGAMLIYTFLEIYLFKIDPDPFYFLRDNEVQEIVGMGYGLYLPLYLIFVSVYVNAFYFIPYLKKLKASKK